MENVFALVLLEQRGEVRDVLVRSGRTDEAVLDDALDVFKAWASRVLKMS